MNELRSIFVVNNFETCDGKHHVSWTIQGNLNDNLEEFDDWAEALIFAFKKYFEIKAQRFVIDCPNHIHELINNNKVD